MRNIIILFVALGVAIAVVAYTFATEDKPASRNRTQRSAEQDPKKAYDARASVRPPETGKTANEGAESTAEAAEAEVGTEAAKTKEDCASILVKLRSKETTASEQSRLWRRLGELGLADEAISAIRAELKVTPRDTDLHTMLGNALVTKMRTETLNPMERRAASTEAMSSFNTALDIDSRNWTARFSRAMSNSNAPAFLGLQAVAIKDFEILVKQQKESAPSEDHSHTYFFLSNLHDGAGNAERARSVRAEAREQFPDDPRFRERERK